MPKQTFIPGPPKVGDTVMVRTMEELPQEAYIWALFDNLSIKEEYVVEYLSPYSSWVCLKGKRHYHHPDRFTVIRRSPDHIINSSQIGEQC